jgi:flagellar motor protein MotB
MNLSKRRAISVGRHLYQAYGVEISRLVITGKGETELYDEKNPESGVNRRVEIRTIVR